MIVVLTLLATAMPQDKPEKAPRPEAKVCRSNSVIGNRAKIVRECRTRAEWRALDDGHRRAGGEMLERSRLGTINNF